MPLIHIRIPSPIQGLYAFPSYVLATAIQTELQKNFHNYKAAATGSGPLGGRRLGMPRAPWPALLSFSPAPTYTLGRRQKEALDVEFESRLRAPLFVVNPPARPGTRHALGEPRSHSFLCDVYRSPRGGLTTYHGPGQLVLWPVIDMRSSLHRHFSVREYSCLLEETTIAALRHATAVFGRGVEGFSVQGNPGVWVRHRAEDGSKEVRKIASVGIHLRRYITGLGVAINVDTVVQGSEATNPWARIVACGQEDTKMTNVVSEMFGDEPLFSDAQLEPLLRRVMLRLRRAWQTEFAQRLKIRAHAGKSRYWHKDFRTEVFFSRPASEPAICEYEWTTNSSRLGSWSGGDRVLQRSEDPLILVKKSKAADGFDAQGLIYGWANKLIFQNGGYVIGRPQPYTPGHDPGV